MKLHLSHRSGASGATMIISLFICTLLAISIAGYLSLTEHQYRMSMRSQEWNVSMAVVEAGVEEALEHINTNPTNLATCGWTASGNCYSLSRTLGPGAAYEVTIDNSDPYQPEILSRATAVESTVAQSFFPAFATIGLTTTASNAPTRAVRVKTERSALYKASVVAKRSIDLKGNGVLSDSYDSSNPWKSTNGRYDPTKYAGDNGDVASNGGILDSVSVGNANIYGRVHVGPDMPVTIGVNGGVGTHLWQATHTGLQEGFVRKDANFTFPDTRLPSVTGLLAPASGDVVLASYTFSTNSVCTTHYPYVPPAGGVYTNVAYETSFTIPTPTPEWVTTNQTQVTTRTPPRPGISPVVTNIYTTNITRSTMPAQGTEILGSVTVNDNKNKNRITYSYNEILYRDYTYGVESYTFPTLTYTYDRASTTATYVTNHYDSIVEAGQTCVAYSLPGKTLIKGANAVLVLPNGMDGAEHIDLDNGASVTLYVGGSSVKINGNEVVNPSGFAGNFIVLCDPAVKSFTLDGNGEFTGVLVAPDADLVMNGGGSGIQDFCGALMCNSLRLNGHFSFHYDEALGKGPSTGRYLITAWDEVN